MSMEILIDELRSHADRLLSSAAAASEKLDDNPHGAFGHLEGACEVIADRLRFTANCLAQEKTPCDQPTE